MLGLPVIDKDSIWERLFDSEGSVDATKRRVLSRTSDEVPQAQARASEGAILVSFWHRPGMATDSGTPTPWLLQLAADIVNVHCVCPPEVAAARFVRRARHPGHLDMERSHSDMWQSLQAVACLEPIHVGARIEVDTSGEVGVEALVRDINDAFAEAVGGNGCY